VGYVQRRGVEPAVLVTASVRRGRPDVRGGQWRLRAVRRHAVQVLSDVERLGVERALAATAYLVVDERRRLGHVQSAPNAHRRAVQVSRADFRHVARTVHLLVFLPVLVVVICL